MNKLFIIGNGFDIAHGIESEYKHFRAFLCREFGEDESEYPDMPQTNVSKDGDIIPDRKRTAGFLIELIDASSKGYDWKDFEETMGRFNYDSLFDELDMASAIADDDDDEMFHRLHDREDLAHEVSLCVLYVKKLFQEWIETVEIDSCERQDRFEELFDEDARFLTFNYTFTLEEIYGIDPSHICHIHGAQGGALVVGHGNHENPYEEEDLSTYGISDRLGQLFEDLKKDVGACYRQHSDFFQELGESGIKEIYSFGFSFSEQDLFYIMQLCSKIDTTNVMWHLAEFDSQKNKYFKECIRNYGFKGKFGAPIPEIR